MLINDLSSLEEKYKNKMLYFEKRIEENSSPNEHKKLLRQYSFSARAYYEVKALMQTHQTVFR